MKLRKFIVPVLAISLFATSCGSDEPTGWSKAAKEFMEDTLGEVLPYAKVNLKQGKYSLEYDSDELGGYFTFQDINETNLVSTYGDALKEAGFTAKSSSVYTKTNELVSMTLTISYQRKTSTKEAGNKLYADYQYLVVEGDWSDALKETMTDKLGFVLPYAFFDEESTTSSFEAESEFVNSFELSDENAENKLKTYGSRLVYSGFKKSTSGGKTVYLKSNENGDVIYVSYGYVPANDTDAGSNVISCSIELDFKNWPTSISTAMSENLGIVLPFAKFGFANAEINVITDEFGGYFSIYEEDVTTNIFTTYNDALEELDFEYSEALEGYVKTTEKASVRVYASYSDYYEANNLYVEFVYVDAPAGSWNEEITQAMTTKVGEVLPYAFLDSATLSCKVNESAGGVTIIISDANSVNKLASYGPRLEDAGFEYHNSWVGSYYEKTLEDETVIDVTGGWYAEEEEDDDGNIIPAGNEIRITVTYPPVKYTTFPKDVILDFAAASEVTIENFPTYNVASENAYFEVEYPSSGSVRIIIYGSNTEELNTFLSSLGEDWAKKSETSYYYYYKDTDINFGAFDYSTAEENPRIILSFYNW